MEQKIPVFNLRRGLLILIVLAVLAVTAVIWRHIQLQSPQDILEALPEQIDLSLAELHYTQNEEGQRSWTLDADKAEYQKDSSQVVLDGVQLTLYRAGRFGQVELKAQQGRMAQEERQIEVWGEVVVETARGEKLLTERLRFDGNQQQLLTAEPIRLFAKQLELTGTGLQVDLEQGRLLVKSDVRALLLPADRKARVDE